MSHNLACSFTSRKTIVCLKLVALFLTIFFLRVLFSVDFSSEIPCGRAKGHRRSMAFSYSINTTWDSKPIDHSPVTISLEPDRCHNLIMTVNAPFFNDPANPGGTPGQPFPGLWDYEVAEAFFLNDHNSYLEVELSPHGQHLLLLLHGVRHSFKQQLPLTYTADIKHDQWTGKATIPSNYFPPKVTKFNAYAIHGSGTNRTYESLYPVPTGKYTDPDFHKLQYFQPIDFQSLLPINWSPDYHSEEWKDYPIVG